jgi:hypothetical protein
MLANPENARAELEPDAELMTFFSRFTTERIKTSGAHINAAYGGNSDGPPLLLAAFLGT